MVWNGGRDNKMRGLFVPEMTVEKFRNKCFESIEALIAEDEIFNIDYDPRHIPAIRDKLWEIQQCSNCVLNPKKKIVEKEPQWIPVSERLPKKPKANCSYYFSAIQSEDVKAEEYIVMIDGAKIPTTLYWDGEYWFDAPSCCEIPYKVKAWMPLPTPYNGGD